MDVPRRLLYTYFPLAKVKRRHNVCCLKPGSDKVGEHRVGRGQRGHF